MTRAPCKLPGRMVILVLVGIAVNIGVSASPASLPPMAQAARSFPAARMQSHPPTLADFWESAAHFIVDEPYTGLPMGESDTVIAPNGEWWSYVHASDRSAGVRDSCGQPVEFPGCVVIYRSRDNGRRFSLDQPLCQFVCRTCPCKPERDHVFQQQYPRVYQNQGEWWMAYELGAGVMLRVSRDGARWSEAMRVTGTGVWSKTTRPCQPYEEIGPHHFAIAGFDCLSGAPPGLFIADQTLYVFVGMGQNPGHMGCLKATIGPAPRGLRNLAGLRFKPCAHNPLFTGAPHYGDSTDQGAMSNPYFDHRTISSADIVRVDGRYYMLFEGTRGPGPGDAGDTQFGLGLARSLTDAIDGPWEQFPGNPILMDLPGNIGLGHADLVTDNAGVTFLFTSLDGWSRSRLRLVWR